MKKIMLLVCFVAAFAGLCYDPTEYQHEVITTSMVAGDTLDSVAERYYIHNQDSRTWQEFRYEVMELNKDLFRNGRLPQIGDKVIIVVAKEVQ